jgi:hypothetical protein
MWKGIRRELSAYPQKSGGKKRFDLLDKSEQFNFFANRYGRREKGQEMLTLRKRETSFPNSLRM